jgi:hypothetical protein
MASGVNVAGLTLRAVATPLAATADRMQTAVTVELTYPLQPGTPRIDDTLALSVYALDPDARVKARSIRQLRVAGSAPPRDSVTLLLDDLVELPSEPLTIRVGVASQRLGRAGTVQLPLDVPDPGDDLQVSGIAIGVAGARAPALNAASIAPVVPFQPTTARAFAGSETLRIFGRAYWRGAAAPAVTVRIESAAATPRAAALGVPRAVRGRQEGAFDVTLPLAGLASGRHVLVIEAGAKGRTAVREIPIVIR